MEGRWRIEIEEGGLVGILCTWVSRSVSTDCSSSSLYVDLRVFKPLLQVVIDGFVRDLADEGEIRNSDFLLSALKNGLPDLGLFPSTTCRLSIARVLLAASAPCDCLLKVAISIYPRAKWQSSKVSHTIVDSNFERDVFAKSGEQFAIAPAQIDIHK